MQVLVNLLLSGSSRGSTETDGGQDDGRIETETVKGDVQSEPRPSGTEQDFSVFPLTEKSSKVGPGSFGKIGFDDHTLGLFLEGTGGEVLSHNNVKLSLVSTPSNRS